MVKVYVILLVMSSYSAYGQYLTEKDIDTCHKSEADLCEEVQVKYDSLYLLSDYPENSTITKGFVFPTFRKTKEEKRNGYFIYRDSMGILPDSISYSYVYVTFWVNPYGKLICFKLLPVPVNLKVCNKMKLLEKELKGYLESKLIAPGYWGENDNRAIYFPQMNHKVEIQNVSPNSYND